MVDRKYTETLPGPFPIFGLGLETRLPYTTCYTWEKYTSHLLYLPVFIYPFVREKYKSRGKNKIKPLIMDPPKSGQPLYSG